VSATARVSALTLLYQLPVRAEANTGYQRAAFGSGWSDSDRDGCDTRKEVLVAEASTAPRRGSSCRLYGGSWLSRYDGRRYTTYGSLDVDHMVPLAEAWASGARRWTGTTRVRFANDLGYPYSLNAVSASANRSKGDREPGSWLPSNRAYRCTYIASWVAVKWRWGLSVDSSERRGLVRSLTACGRSALISRPAKATVRTTSPTPTPPPSTGTDPRFATCSAAKAAGYGPYRRGIDPEYSWYRDGDGDGVVCE